MTPAATSGRGGQTARDAATAAYIGAVVLLAVLLFVVSLRSYGLEPGVDLAVFVLLVVSLFFVNEAVVEGRTVLSIWSILLLASQAIVGPAGAALLGALMGALQGRSVRVRNRVFNSAQNSVIGALGGLAFAASGGTVQPSELIGFVGILLGLALPLFLADLVQVAGNAVMLAGVFVVSGTGSVRTVVLPLLRSTGLSYVGYGSIALLMLVLWRPAGIGPTSALLVLAPLLVAQWAYRQHAEELRGQDRALQVLVAAVEAKAPHLVSHSDRVATLCSRMVEDLGLAGQVVADVRMAGMLHDVGQTGLPTPVVRQSENHSPALADYPRRGVEILSGLGFLRGALVPIAEHRDALDRAAEDGGLPGRIVGLADAYDLLTEVGSPEGHRLTGPEAVASLRSRPGVDDRLLRALEGAVARRDRVAAR